LKLTHKLDFSKVHKHYKSSGKIGGNACGIDLKNLIFIINIVNGLFFLFYYHSCKHVMECNSYFYDRFASGTRIKQGI